jgi:hypothetical protein
VGTRGFFKAMQSKKPDRSENNSGDKLELAASRATCVNANHLAFDHDRVVHRARVNAKRVPRSEASTARAMLKCLPLSNCNRTAAESQLSQARIFARLVLSQ